MNLRTKTTWPILACLLASMTLCRPTAQAQPIAQTQPAAPSQFTAQTQPPRPAQRPPLPPATDSTPAKDSAISFYHSWLTPETHLYRGQEYVVYTQLLKEGYPYFGENSRRKGAICYDGILYKNVYLYYDLVTSQVVINDVYNVFKIALYNELIDSFSIEDHFFINLRDSLNPTAPRNGFYEQLYKGKIQLLKKEKKQIQEDLSDEQKVQRYIDGADSSYYLKIGNVYHPVNNARSLSHALKDRSRDLKKFIRSHKLSMRKQREFTLIKVAAWYDNLAH